MLMMLLHVNKKYDDYDDTVQVFKSGIIKM